jgi:hypothetical protein
VSDSYIDQDLAIVIALGVVAAIYLALAVSNFRSGRAGHGIARLFAAALFGGVAFFFATFEMRLF